MRCSECHEGEPVDEGICEACLGWLAANMQEQGRPLFAPEDVDAAYDEAERASSAAISRDAGHALLYSTPTAPLAEILGAIANREAYQRRRSLACLIDGTRDAWREWRKWEAVQRWRARRVAS